MLHTSSTGYVHDAIVLLHQRTISVQLYGVDQSQEPINVQLYSVDQSQEPMNVQLYGVDQSQEPPGLQGASPGGVGPSSMTDILTQS